FVEHGDVSTGEDVFQCPGIAGYWPFLSDGVEQPYAVALQERSCLLHKRRDELLPHMFKHSNGNEFVELALNGPIIFEDDRNLFRQTLTLQLLGCILNLLLRKRTPDTEQARMFGCVDKHPAPTAADVDKCFYGLQLKFPAYVF